MSSCSFASDREDQASNGPDKIQNQQLEAETDHLKEVNKQLQGSIDSLKQQLRDAMEATATLNGMNETIAQLKQQLEDSKEKEKNLTKDLKKAQADGEELAAKLNDEIASLQHQNEETQAKLNDELDHVSKLKKERCNLKNEIDEKTTIIENMAIELKDAKTSKKKIRAKFIETAENLQKVQEENQKLNISVQDAENEKNTLAQEIESLRNKLSIADAAKDEVAQQVAQLQKEAEKKTSVIATFEEQLESQRSEMEEMTEERQNIILLIQKMHATLAQSELKVEALTKDNAVLKQKLQKASKGTKTTAAYDVSALTMPFDGDMGEKVEQLIHLPQYQPVQRVQLIINEAAKRIREYEESIKEKDMHIQTIQTQLDQAVTGQTPYCQILDALLKDLKNIAFQEAQINNANICRVDTQFIELMAEKSAEIEPLIREELLKDPRFIPSDFFTTPDINKKKEYIHEIINVSDVSYTIFTAQFLTNQLLVNQLNALMGPLGKMEEISRLDVVGGDFNDIPNLLKSLQDKIAKLKKTRTQLHTLLKQQTENANNLAKSQNELKTKCSQLQITNDALQSEVDVLKVKYQVASNELLLKQNEENLNEFANQLRGSVDEQESETRQRTDRLEQELQEKTKQCAELSSLIKNLQQTLEISTKKQNRRAAKTEDALKGQIAEMQQALEMLEQEVANKKKTAKRNEKSLREQYDASIQDLTSHYEESKRALLRTIEELKDKAAEAREATKKLQQNVAESEAKNTKLVDENANLCEEKKSLNAQLLTIKQQVQKEKQHLQIQLAAQTMAMESKIQTATQEAKAEGEKRLKELYDTVADTLGSYYGFDDTEFSEDSLKQILAHAKEDLDRLQYFQNEATKM